MSSEEKIVDMIDKVVQSKQGKGELSTKDTRTTNVKEELIGQRKNKTAGHHLFWF